MAASDELDIELQEYQRQVDASGILDEPVRATLVPPEKPFVPSWYLRVDNEIPSGGYANLLGYDIDLGSSRREAAKSLNLMTRALRAWSVGVFGTVHAVLAGGTEALEVLRTLVEDAPGSSPVHILRLIEAAGDVAGRKRTE